LSTTIHARETSLIYAEIVRQIATGELSPGQRLVELDLARSFGTSRTPIREVLFQLEKDGLVQRNHNQGARVAAFTPDDIEQLYEIRAALECLAIRKGIKNIELSVLFELDRKLEMCRNMTGDSRATQLYEIDLELHELVAASSGSQRLILNLERLGLVINSVRLLTHGSNQSYALGIEEHLGIIRALIRRDSETAERLMAEHIDGAKRRAIEFVQQMGKKNTTSMKSGRIKNTRSSAKE
jgi:DNA-binding GntR family transcriptional regulator